MSLGHYRSPNAIVNTFLGHFVKEIAIHHIKLGDLREMPIVWKRLAILSSTKNTPRPLFWRV